MDTATILTTTAPSLPLTPTALRATQCPTWKAYFPKVLTTSLKGILEVKVWPWYTMGSPFGPSQQSTSRQRQPRFRALWVGSHPSTPARAPSPSPPSGCGITPAGSGDMRQGEDIHLGMDGGREKWMDSGKEKLGLASPKGTLLLGMAMPLVVLGASGREQPIT